MVNLLDVRTANTARGHAEQDFALANFRNRHRLDDYPALAAVNARAHVPRMLTVSFVRSDSSGCMAHWPAAAAPVSRTLARSTSIGTYRSKNCASDSAARLLWFASFMRSGTEPGCSATCPRTRGMLMRPSSLKTPSISSGISSPARSLIARIGTAGIAECAPLHAISQSSPSRRRRQPCPNDASLRPGPLRAARYKTGQRWWRRIRRQMQRAAELLSRTWLGKSACGASENTDCAASTWPIS